MNALKDLGDKFHDPSIQESLVWLEPHLQVVFAQNLQIGVVSHRPYRS
jgi:hypothetical protein